MAEATNKVYYCPIELTLDLVASKWQPTLLRHLAAGGCRRGELRRRLPLVTRKALTGLLHQLERDGLIERTLHSDHAERVEYALTELGRRLTPLLDRLAEFGEVYAAEREIEILSDEDAEALEVEETPAGGGMGKAGRWLAWSWLPL